MTMEMIQLRHRRVRKPETFVLALTVYLFAAGCGGGKSVETGPDPLATIDPTSLRNQPNLVSQGYDLNNDGRPDIFVYWRQVISPDRTIRSAQVLKELDVNFDGRIDIWRIWKYSGEIARQWEDTDGDGRADVVWIFEDNRLAMKTFDTNGDGRPDLWHIFNEQGYMAEKRRDGDGNGQPDYFEYYTMGRLEKAGWDNDGDGEPDEFGNPAPAYPAAAPGGYPPMPGANPGYPGVPAPYASPSYTPR